MRMWPSSIPLLFFTFEILQYLKNKSSIVFAIFALFLDIIVSSDPKLS